MFNATSDNTYILTAKPNTKKPASGYWHNFTTPKLKSFRGKHGNDFFLLVEGSRNSDDDFFLIPFDRAAKAQLPNQRWIGTIKPEGGRWIMDVRIGAGFAFDVTDCRNAGPRPYRLP